MSRPFTRFALLTLVLSMMIEPAPGRAEASSWSIVSSESAIAIVATQMGAPFNAAFERFSGDIRFDPGDAESSHAIIVIDVASFDSGNADRDSQAHGPDFFDVAAYPEARFETTAFRRDGDGWIADATLTIKGITQLVSLPFSLKIDGGRAVMRGSLEIDRGVFEVGTGQWFSASSGVGREVRIDVTVAATRN